MRHKSLIVLTLLLLVAYAIRVYALGDKAIWWDEAWSVWTAQQSFAQTTEITAEDVHPPLYQWALHGWVRIAGISELAVRYLSLLFGMITVAAVYPITARIGGKRAALLATFFIAISTFHLHWSQETRMYAMAACAGLLACYAYLRTGPRWSAWWLLLILASAAAALTHYLGAMILVVINLHWLLTFRSRRPAYHRRWLIAMFITGLILAAWITFAISRTRSGGVDSNVAPAFVFQLLATLLAAGTSVNVEQYMLVTLIVMLGFFGGLILYSRRHWRSSLLIWLMALFPPFVIFLLSFPNRFYHPKPEERYLVIFAPLLYTGIGLALNELLKLRRIVGRAAVIGLLALYGYAYLLSVDGRYYRDDYAMMLRTIQLLGQQDEPIFFVSGDRYPLVYYHLNLAAGGYSPRLAEGVPLMASDPSVISGVIGTNTRFWVVEIERALGDPQNIVIPWLDAHYHRLLRIPVDYNGVSLYSSAYQLLPDSDQVLPPVIREARPGDVARIGVPGRVAVDLLYQDKVIASQPAGSTWQLAQFPIYPAYPPGNYTLRAGAQRYDFQITHSQPTPANPDSSINQTVGPFRLIGYSADTRRIRPGSTVQITLYWQVNAVPPDNYTAFVHLLGPINPATKGPLWAGQDGYPAGTPTRALWIGQVVADRHSLHVLENTPPGAYTIEIGLYTLENGKRLIFGDGTDHVQIAGFEVSP